MAKVAKKRKTFVDVLFEKRRGMVRLENAGAASLRRQMRRIKRDSLKLIERNMGTFRRTGEYIDSPSALMTAKRTATEMDILLQQRLAGPTNDVIRLRQTAWDQGVIDLKGASRRLPQGIQTSMNASFGQVDLQAAIAARTNPVFGVNPRAAFNGVRGHTSKKVQELLSSAVLSSASVKETAQQLADAMDLNVAAAQRIVRTNMNAAYNEAHRAIYNANPEIFSGYRWEAVFDDRTSVICLELHGSFYPLGTVPPGPPAHWNCRSILVGVFRDQDIEKVVEDTPRRVREFKELPDGTFKSITKTVAGDLRASDWLKSQPFGIVQDVTGSRIKAEFFIRGTASLDDIVTPALGVRNNKAFMRRMAALHPRNKRYRKMARELGVKKIPSKASIARGDAISAGKQPFVKAQELPTVVGDLVSKPIAKIVEPFPKQYNQWVKSLSDDERSAIRDWGRTDWKDIRRAQLGRSVSPRIRETLSNLNSALSRAPVREQTVYRGLSKVGSKAFDDILTSKTLSWKTHASSTRSMQKGRGFATRTRGNNILFEIRQKSGVEIERIVVPGEQEVLLLQKTKYRVISREWKSFRNPFFREIFRYVHVVLEEI